MAEFQINGQYIMGDGSSPLYDSNFNMLKYDGNSIVRTSGQSTNLYSQYGQALQWDKVGSYCMAYSYSKYTYWTPLVGGNREFGSRIRTVIFTSGNAMPINWATSSGSNGYFSGTYEHMTTRSSYYNYYICSLYQRIA